MRALWLLLLLTACDLDLHDPLGTGSYEYDVRTPQAYGNSTQRWPVIFFLHGSQGLATNYIADYAKAREPFPFIVVTPRTEYEWEPKRLSNLLEEIRDKYRVDDRRVYVTGFSMGAHGAFDWAAAEPALIAAAVLIAGAGRPGQGCKIKDVPVWFIHNRGDPIVPTAETERTVQELQACGVTARVTINENPPLRDTHNAWGTAYQNAELYTWLLAHTK